MSHSERFFYINGQLFEKVGTRKTNNGKWVHTIKLPYSKLETRSRYEEVTDVELNRILK